MARRRSWLKLIVAMAIVALGSTLFSAFSATPASGVATTVTITQSPKFSGVVSAAAPCQANRSVKVKKIRRGRDRLIGTTTTNASGQYTVPSVRQFGRYKAVAKEVTATGTGTGYGYSYGSVPVICEKGRSDVLNLGRNPHRRRRR